MTAPHRRSRTVGGWVAAVVISLPVVALLETLQLDGSDQSPGTPSVVLIVAGAVLVVPLLLLSSAVLVRFQDAAKRRGLWRAKSIFVPISAALTAAFGLLAVYGRGWLGALAAIGAAWQCLFTLAVTLRGRSAPVIGPPPRGVTFADISTMSAMGRAEEALEILKRVVVDPSREAVLVAVKAECTYRVGLFEEAIGLYRRLAEIGAAEAPSCRAVAADARLSAALRDGRDLRRDELAECMAAIHSPSLPEIQVNSASFVHTKALLTLASGDPGTAMRMGLDVLRDKSVTPADRAMVIAMVVIAAVRAGDQYVARWWDPKVPNWCPLRAAVDREMGRWSPQGDSNPRDDSDCVILE